MGTLSLLPLSLCTPLRPRPASSQTHLCNPVSWPLVSLTYPTRRRLRSKNVVFGSNSIDPKESEFLDENGVVDDMDGYMNYLSLEYDSVWDTKPSWWAFPSWASIIFTVISEWTPFTPFLFVLIRGFLASVYSCVKVWCSFPVFQHTILFVSEGLFVC